MLTLLVSLALIAQSPPPPPRLNDPFILFFDYASAKLGPEDHVLVANIHYAYKFSKAKRVDIIGHADRKGSSSFNLRLSRRRGEAVKAALVSRGVPAEAVTVDGVGEDSPIVETADDVPHAQNRYVAVMMH